MLLQNGARIANKGNSKFGQNLWRIGADIAKLDKYYELGHNNWEKKIVFHQHAMGLLENSAKFLNFQIS